ncbi:hypothetical protein HC928_18675 [bacterium]|nr:hypothetical protein [bacterium]
MSQLTVQKNSLFGVIEKKVLLRKLKPSLEETIEVIRKTPEYYEEFEKAVKKLSDRDSAAYRNINRLLDRVPDSLKDSMSALAQKIRLSTEDTADDLQKLQMEVETWFDNAMSRASGVYKRNARGIAILIGLMIATATNADTFHMVNRLSKDSVLRATVTQSAERLVSENPATVEEIRAINNEVNQVLEDFPLPIGWNQSNVQSQIEAERGWPLGYSKRALGWLISGIAISMGAAFWFNLLSKVVDIRAIGSTKSGKNADKNTDKNDGGRSPY